MEVGNIVLLIYSVISIGVVYAVHYWFMREKDYEWKKYLSDSFYIISISSCLVFFIGIFIADYVSKVVS